MECGVSSLLLEARVVLSGLLLWFTLFPRGLEQPAWCRLCAGAALCQPTEAFGTFPHPRRVVARAVRTWKFGLRDLCPHIFSPCLVFRCCLWSTSYWFFGTRALFGSTVDTRSTGGFGRFSLIFIIEGSCQFMPAICGHTHFV